MEVVYKNFEIKSDPQQDQESKEWETSVIIIKHTTSKINQRLFSDSKTHKTKEEARKYSIEFGQQVIDGDRHGLSVSDM